MSRRSREPTRQELFGECATGAEQTRTAYGLQAVTYAGKLNETQVEGLLKFMRAKGYRSFSQMIEHASLAEASNVLCRWPRPSELAQMAKASGSEDMHVWRATVEVGLRDPGGFVGTYGSNLSDLTERTGLLYVWLHSTHSNNKNNRKTHRLYLYGTSRRVVTEAAKDAFVAEAAVDKPVVVRVRIGDALEWEGKGSDLNPLAREFKKPSKLRAEAKAFAPGRN
jgi:hypothetical protein